MREEILSWSLAFLLSLLALAATTCIVLGIIALVAQFGTGAILIAVAAICLTPLFKNVLDGWPE